MEASTFRRARGASGGHRMLLCGPPWFRRVSETAFLGCEAAAFFSDFPHTMFVSFVEAQERFHV
jgi:hypothetical protein